MDPFSSQRDGTATKKRNEDFFFFFFLYHFKKAGRDAKNAYMPLLHSFIQNLLPDLPTPGAPTTRTLISLSKDFLRRIPRIGDEFIVNDDDDDKARQRNYFDVSKEALRKHNTWSRWDM